LYFRVELRFLSQNFGLEIRLIVAWHQKVVAPSFQNKTFQNKTFQNKTFQNKTCSPLKNNRNIMQFFFLSAFLKN
jgi:hypothetical protein